MKKVIYVTGSGSSGTHIASRFLGSVLPAAHEIGREYKNWEREPPSLNSMGEVDYLVFHRPLPNLTRFHALFGDKALSLVMLRDPIQFWSRRSYATLEVLFSGFSFERPDRGHVPRQNFIWLANAFAQSRRATAVWRLEDFSRDWQTRRSLVERDLGVALDATDPKDIAVGKSFAQLQGGVHQISGDEYASVLSPFEFEAFEYAFSRVPELGHYYPGALANCEVLETSDPRFFQKRYADFFRQYPRRRLAVKRAKGQGGLLDTLQFRLEHWRARGRVRELLCTSDAYRWDYKEAIELALCEVIDPDVIRAGESKGGRS